MSGLEAGLAALFLVPGAYLKLGGMNHLLYSPKRNAVTAENPELTKV
jgi:hypothetical protein